MNHLVWAQLIFTVLGAVLFTGLYLIFFRRRQVATSTSRGRPATRSPSCLRRPETAAIRFP